MALPFAGAALPLNSTDLSSIAAQIGCDVATVLTVTTVETGGLGGFLSDGSGRPIILFEAAVFSSFTGGRYDASHPGISSREPNWKLYRGGPAEYERLATAVELDRDSALQSTSWGMFQVMGENYATCMFSAPGDMVKAMAHSEGAQLMAFGQYCMRTAGCADALRRHDWTEFARLYNGPEYAKNHYDTKLAAAYGALTGAILAPVRIGGRGPLVLRLQQALGANGEAVPIDGDFGRVTELAVMRFQDAHWLEPDGVVGDATAHALGIS